MLNQVVSDAAAQLRKRRESRRLTMEEIHRATKIRISVIKALENGRWDDVPGGVYLRSFVVEYANFLGLNGEVLYAPYQELLSKQHRKKKEEVESTAQADQRQRLIWVSAGIASIFILGMIRFFVIDSEPEPIEPALQGSVPVEPAPEPPPAPVLDSHVLEVYSPNPLWLRVEAEDKTFEGFIPQRSTWSWTGLGRFVVRLGHTQDISVLFDGQTVAVAENQKRVYLPLEGPRTDARAAFLSSAPA